MSAATTAALVALYNGQDYIEQQLDSIAAQSRPVDEIILRDDMSTDSTVAVVKDWMARHPQIKTTLIQADKNQGYKENFRQLMAACEADWMFLCDQDDRWHEDKVQTLMQVIEENPSIQLAASSFSFMDQNGDCFSRPEKSGWSNHDLIPMALDGDEVARISLQPLLDHNFWQGCASVISRPLANEYVARDDMRLPHDWLLNLMAAAKGQCMFVNTELFDYRIHSGNETGLPQAKKRTLATRLKAYSDKEGQKKTLEGMALALQSGFDYFPQQMTRQNRQTLKMAKTALSLLDTGSFKDFMALAACTGVNRTLKYKLLVKGLLSMLP